MNAPATENLTSLDWRRRTLPEDYAEGQRQYDMALAAKTAAEPLVWSTGAGAFWLATLLLNPIAGVFALVLTYWACMRPLKKRLKQASVEWELDRKAWELHIASPVPPRGRQP